MFSLVLIVLMTGCRATEVITEKPDETEIRETIVSMLPEAPSVPGFPSLSWSHQDGLYCLKEADADKLLDFKENALPFFVFDYEAWIEEVKVVLNKLI